MVFYALVERTGKQAETGIQRNDRGEDSGQIVRDAKILGQRC